jgi:molecular chaperone HtpG
MVMGLDEYKGHKFRNVDEADIDLSDIGEVQAEAEAVKEPLPEDDFSVVQSRFETVLGDRVRGVRAGKAMVGSAARLVSEEGSSVRNMFRINRLLDKSYELPVKTLELNPRHPLLHNLTEMIKNQGDPALIDAVVEQVFETALLQDGIHPDPAAMATRLTLLMQAATGSAVSELNFGDTYHVEVPQPKPDPFAGFAEDEDETEDEVTAVREAVNQPAAESESTPDDSEETSDET